MRGTSRYTAAGAAFMTRVVATLGLVLLFLSRLAAQQTGLTDAQLKAAEIELPPLIELLELKPGMTVADVGAGFGAWTMRFSRWLGPEGRVYATDIGAAQLAALRDAATRESGAALTHVRTIPMWAPDSQPASLYLVLFRKP